MAAAEKEVSAKTASVVEKVKMTDGREVDFVGKRKLLKESIIGDDGSVTVRLDFRNGETRSWRIPDSLIAKCAGHGGEQKLGDETAGIDDVDDMILAVDELIERLNTGPEGWTTRREGSGMAGTSVLIKALVEYSKRSVEQVKEFLKSKTQAEKLALRNSAQLKDIVAKLEAEKVSKAAKVDTGALFAELS